LFPYPIPRFVPLPDRRELGPVTNAGEPDAQYLVEVYRRNDQKGPAVELTDSEAVARSLDGDPEAFAALVRRHSQAVHGYLFRRSDAQTADDLLADVWLRAFRSRHGYDRGWSTARPWLYGIAANALRAHWRQPVAGHGSPVEPGHDPWSDADARIDAARRWPALRAAIGQLCPEDRDVLLLFAWERLRPAEIAVCLDIPPGTARWRLHRARHLVQMRLDDDTSLRPVLPCTTKEA
jgi:RNA polymerase sigma factor (sigma-70 family)